MTVFVTEGSFTVVINLLEGEWGGLRCEVSINGGACSKENAQDLVNIILTDITGKKPSFVEFSFGDDPEIYAVAKVYEEGMQFTENVFKGTASVRSTLTVSKKEIESVFERALETYKRKFIYTVTPSKVLDRLHEVTFIGVERTPGELRYVWESIVRDFKDGRF